MEYLLPSQSFKFSSSAPTIQGFACTVSYVYLDLAMAQGCIITVRLPRSSHKYKVLSCLFSQARNSYDALRPQNLPRSALAHQHANDMRGGPKTPKTTPAKVNDPSDPALPAAAPAIRRKAGLAHPTFSLAPTSMDLR